MALLLLLLYTSVEQNVQSIAQTVSNTDLQDEVNTAYALLSQFLTCNFEPTWQKRLIRPWRRI